ncbi:MAG: acetate/propionate family kinase [Candidatus Marinimicrobia bacterium]|nr:acetate/propionate family kinase [Candidatus Neomarinimicrobiota bacterium]
MNKTILVINSGSTSLKYKLFVVGKNLREQQSGYIENIGAGKVKNHDQALQQALQEINDLDSIVAVGHRVVHGGEEFTEPIKIGRRVVDKLQQYNKLAPLHNPANIQGIKACLKLLPGVPNVAVFDTGFHRNIPEKAYRYALPEKYYKQHKIRRYGFHGISYQYVVGQAMQTKLKKKPRAKIIACHLGGGCSVSASVGGKSIDTSMGFTPLEGLIMMSRSGDLDPGVVLFLQRELKMSAQKVDELLNKESGIYGLAGEKDWLKLLQKMRRGNKKAQLAFDMFCYRIKKYIGAYYAALGGLDGLIFTGAIGSGDATTRRKICAGLPFLQNVPVMAIKTDEEKMIAQEVIKKI